MTITLELTPEVEARLGRAAQSRGLDIPTFLQEYLPIIPLPVTNPTFPVSPPSQQEKDNLAALFQSFQEGDADEQRETLDALQKSLAENPVSFREYILPDDYED